MTVSFQNGSFFGGSAFSGACTQAGGVTSASLYNLDSLDNRYNYTDTKEDYEMSYAGRDASLDTYIANISSYIANGKEDYVIETYNALLEEMRGQTRYSTVSQNEVQLRAIARQLIESQIGCDLEAFIRENTKDQAGVDVQKILTWGNCDSTSQEDLLAELCNYKEEEGRGSIILGALAGIASPFVVGWNALFNGSKKM